MRPALRLLRLVAAWVLLAALAAWQPALLPAWLATGAVLLVAAALDAARVWRAPAPRVERRVAHSLPLGVWTPVQLRVASPGRACALHVHDRHPPDFEAASLPLRVDPDASGWVERAYRVRPRRRGSHRFEHVDTLLDSPWGLWQRRRSASEPLDVRVYPDFRAVARYSLVATDNRRSELGIRRRQRRGEGLDFHQLREYRLGDPPRQIDWKATSRMRRLISREYSDERDQQVVFLLDCGQKMHARDGDAGLAHFDHALNAVLLLSHVVLRQGDAVGLMTFGGERRWLAPRKGVGSLTPLLNGIYDLSTSLEASDYPEIARELMRRVTKRSLVILVTNLRDEDSEELRLAAGLLRRRHLVLVASLRESVLDEVLAAGVSELADALRVAAAHEYLEQRRVAHERVRAGGVLLLDARPEELPVRLVNRYLEVKGSGQL